MSNSVEITPGDIVRLKSGGNQWVVEKIDELGVKCVKEVDGFVVREYFAAPTLEKVLIPELQCLNY